MLESLSGGYSGEKSSKMKMDHMKEVEKEDESLEAENESKEAMCPHCGKEV